MFLYVGIRIILYVLARAMASDCSEVDLFGSGKPSLGLKKLRIDIAGHRTVCTVCLPQIFAVLIICCRKTFRSPKRLRKYLNNENFQIYGITAYTMQRPCNKWYTLTGLGAYDHTKLSKCWT